MIAEFSLLLTGGMGLMWCLMPRSQVTAGFFRIQMLIVIGLSMLAILTMGHLASTESGRIASVFLIESRIATGMTLIGAYLGSIFWLLGRRGPGTSMMYLVVVSAVTSLICCRGGISGIMNFKESFHLVSSFATACVMGSAVTGMLLGHWYLTAPTMSIEPLKRLCWYFAAAVTFRLVVSFAGWIIAGDQIHDGIHWTWFALRWLAGIAGPLVISIMAIRILRYRNTQAATGVLFAGVILTFIGEMSASLLYTELHIPF